MTIYIDIIDCGCTVTNITIEDNGIGIANADSDKVVEINNKYLKIGRKRRKAENCSLSSVYKRKIQGKKGIGKLAGFGITKKIKVSTVSNHILNTFVLDYDEMHSIGADEEYYPKHIDINQYTNKLQGTSIELCEIFKKNEINLKKLVIALVKRNKIFATT